MPLSFALASLAAATLWLVLTGWIWISVPWKRRILKITLGVISLSGTVAIIIGGSVASLFLNDRGKARQELSNASDYAASEVRWTPKQRLQIEIIDSNRVALNGTTVPIDRLGRQLKTDLKVPPSQASVSLSTSSAATAQDVVAVKKACSRAGITEVTEAPKEPLARSSRL
ncbi:biopolymer transporter ExbD [Luteolibacter sp. LG18]|uniref:ExbD/TolR family protein n=1 Tax=Luteolibacter sp. LG18 TaxID=2819286 RepID=UPI002B2F5B77|nr:hypothetical protein llg_44640 [Luteolibacter sp. LG18]